MLAALEFAPALPLERYAHHGPPKLEAAYAYLAENVGPEAVVVEVPFASPADPFRETPRMYRSTHGFWRLVSGFATYMPEGNRERRAVLNTCPGPESLAELRRLDADYVVVHPDEYAEDGLDAEAVLRAAEDEPALQRVAGGGEKVLYRVERPRDKG